MKSYLLFFDGYCHLCNRSVDFVLKRDKNCQIQFCSIQSAHLHPLTPTLLATLTDDSVVLYCRDDGVIYQKSEAVFEIIRIIGGVWKSLLICELLPRQLRDRLYKSLAENRYKLFGKKDHCRIPTTEVKDRFL